MRCRRHEKSLQDLPVPISRDTSVGNKTVMTTEVREFKDRTIAGTTESRMEIKHRCTKVENQQRYLPKLINPGYMVSMWYVCSCKCFHKSSWPVFCLTGTDQWLV